MHEIMCGFITENFGRGFHPFFKKRTPRLEIGMYLRASCCLNDRSGLSGQFFAARLRRIHPRKPRAEPNSHALAGTGTPVG
jgi:hypothetical protein